MDSVCLKREFDFILFHAEARCTQKDPPIELGIKMAPYQTCLKQRRFTVKLSMNRAQFTYLHSEF